MFFKKSLFGYSKKDVQSKIEDYESLIDLQRRDIEFLKRDNLLLKSTLSKLNRDDDSLEN